MVLQRYKSFRALDLLDAGMALWTTHFYPEEPWSKHLLNVAIISIETFWTNLELANFTREQPYR